MQRNTVTTLGQLHAGDRFAYPKRVDIWQVVAQVGDKVAINQFLPDGQRIHHHDEFKKGSQPVRFLRHTQPLPGEECQVCDLKPGDVFFDSENIIIEWQVSQKEYPRVLAFNTKAPEETKAFDWMEYVTFVRKSEAV